MHQLPLYGGMKEGFLEVLQGDLGMGYLQMKGEGGAGVRSVQVEVSP